MAASIISLFILIFFLILNSKSDENNIKYYSKDEGILSIMYHRFNENKYPSTNIKIDMFKAHINKIKNSNYYFYNPINLKKEFYVPRKKKTILMTIDDAFKSFYTEAWPILKKEKIPFILFVSTEPVGGKGYMTWEQIKEIDKEKFTFIGHHSHSHEYLIDKNDQEFIKDIETANKIFLNHLGYIPNLFSYPFGEYSEFMKNYISKNFDFAFGQHSGVIDLNKDKYELPRFPINEKYGDLERFKFLINLLPIQYKVIIPEEKYLLDTNNPPELVIEFFNNQPKINKINCFSNEGGEWKNSKLNYKKNKIEVIFTEKFLPRRGRINCSMQDKDGWRWFGTQFTLN